MTDDTSVVEMDDHRTMLTSLSLCNKQVNDRCTKNWEKNYKKRSQYLYKYMPEHMCTPIPHTHQ